ncbi:TIM-barrel domain-containing protein [Pseudocnuella soli]|uniref:TIM-barrel domain-containing protein n=1 Tax=Pseudocnuella soli TaxID=2502779 RepID=UPI00104E13F5|nr:TIM-barrel domain-containing protein [Pseudocnuella soli]
MSRYFFLLLLLCSTLAVAAQSTAPFVKTKDGIVVYPQQKPSGNAAVVRLQVVAPNIIRVSASPEKDLPATKSLVVNYQWVPSQTFSVTEGKGAVRIKAAKIAAEVNLATGNVQFFDVAGKKLVAEAAENGREIKPVVHEGEPMYSVAQTFTATANEAWYGLGQHQDGVMNYRGQQVQFFQNNTEVAVPFLVSTKGYGILWDNYSLTKAGDVRPLRPLSDLKLFSKNGEEGWLTATYSNDKTKPEVSLMERAESEINMEFLGESAKVLPAQFTPATGVVAWEGSIQSGLSGRHQLRFVYGGTIRLWLNDSLVLDRWRKAWNPAPALVPIDMQPGKKVKLRMEWIPEGTESYLAVKWQEPVAAEARNNFSFASEAGRQVDYYVISGQNMDSVIAGYRTLTGKAPIMPKWAMGFWQSRERYKTQAELLATVAEFRKRNIPLDNIVLDWSYWKEDAWGSQEFDETRFPNPEGMIDTLHRQYNTKIMISVWPKFYEGIPAYHAFNEKGWLYRRNIADRQRDWIGKGYTSTFYDAFNADARKGFWDLIYKKIYTKGFDAWWMDASEPDILSNVSPQKRKLQMQPTALGTATEYLNAYPLQNAKGIYEGQRSSDPNKRVFLLTRSGFAGSQRYAAAIWSGDIGSTWHDLKAQVAAGVNFSMSGLPYWTMDIGGFVVPAHFEKPTAADTEAWRELQTRWFQFGAFVPLFRAHGQFPFREVFNIAPESHAAYQSMLYYNKLRYRLMPYVYSLAGNAYHSEGTIMRGLAMDFRQDSAVWNIDDQYLFGPSLMVAPVWAAGLQSRPVYLPKGKGWYNFYTGAWQAGGQMVTAAAPYERMPLFVPEGAIIPFGPELQYTDEKPADTLTLQVYRGKDGSFTLYEDGGTTYAYEKGQFSTIPFTYNEAAGTLTIGDRKGSFPGMIAKRFIRIKAFLKAAAKPFNLEAPADKAVVYEGKKITVKL